MNNDSKISPDMWDQIQFQFNRIKEESGIELDDDYEKELEELLGISYDEIQQEAETTLRTQRVEIELMNENAKMPSYVYPSDSGFDVYASENVTINPLDRALVPTGIKVSFPENLELQIRPKSGLAINYGLTVLNTPGTIDHQYSGEIKVIIFNTNQSTIKIEKGSKIAQAVLCPVIQGKYVDLVRVDQIKVEGRGNNGFGSSGII